MGSPTTAREALIVELIGEVGTLIDRVDALKITMDRAREAMVEAAWTLDSRVEPFQHQIAAAVDKSKSLAIDDVKQMTFRLTLFSMEKQKEAMRESARSIVTEEVGPTLRELAGSLKGLVARLDRPWEGWLIHAATVGTSVACVYLFQLLAR